jgi:hypothetical protein
MQYQYPLNMSFKILALAPQITITDASDRVIMYVKQKLFKLKEEVQVFSDVEKSRQIFAINADRIIDFSARYNFTDMAGNPLGAVKRRGMKSLWKAHYDIFDGEIPVFEIQEENVMIRVADGCLSSIPIVGAFSGYLFHPAFLVSRGEIQTVMRFQKMPAFFEGKFIIEPQAELSPVEENRVLLSLIMMILLERQRG